MISIREVKSHADLKKFVHLPYKLHRNHKEWLPPLISDEWKVFDRKKNHVFEHCETILLLAYRGKKVVGRVMGIINRAYNEKHNENYARFSFMECPDENEIVDALYEAISEWAKKHKTEKIVGPLGFSDKDPQGFLIYGFDDPMTVMVTNCSFEYMPFQMERLGFEKKLDLVQYRANIPKTMPEVYTSIAERVKKSGFKLLEFDKTRKVKPYIQTVFNLINESYTEIYGFAPLTQTEAKEFANRFLPLLKARYIKLVEDKDGKLAAFVVAMPDLSDGFRKAKGKLFPFGFIHLLKSYKKSNQLDLLLGSVKKDYRNSGLDALMAVSLIGSAMEGGLKYIDSHLIMEENTPMRAVMQRVDSTIYKRYRIYQKDLG